MEEKTNGDFAKNDKAFKKACDKVSQMGMYGKIDKTARQASKWRNGKKIAYKKGREKESGSLYYEV